MIKIIEKDINKLVPYENNARINDKAVDVVANSIEEFGFRNPCIIDKNNVLVAGHTRVLACKKLGITKVPCIVADDLTEEQIKAFRIADNSSAQVAEWDMDKLMAELETIDYDMSKYGLAEQLEQIQSSIDNNNNIEEDDYEEPENLEPKVKRGEIYQLGNHRLMCGDSTKEEDVAKLMDGELADLVVTDPPYNVDVSNSQGMKIKNDNMDDDDFYKFLENTFCNMYKFIKKDGVYYIWCIDHKIDLFIKAVKNNNFIHNQTLIWNKNTFVLGHLDYHKKHEPCLYGWKKGANHYFTDDRTQSTVIEDSGINLKRLKKEEMLKLLQDIFSDKVSTTIINEDKPSKCDLHPTMKPIKLIARLIKNSSRKDENVLDLFGGSGSTLIACEQLNRNCYMMELDEHYCDIIIDRWEKLTNKKAVLING